MATEMALSPVMLAGVHVRMEALENAHLAGRAGGYLHDTWHFS